MLKPRIHPADALPNADGVWLCVLASGSSGNCSVLITRRGSIVRATLIDLGLSPRRTFQLLAERGIEPYQLDDAIVTHLDADHFQPTWRSCLPRHARLRVHASHARDLSPDTPRACPVVPFADPFDLAEGVHVEPLILSHDDEGVAALRFDFPAFSGASLGFATDLGHVTHELVQHFAGARTHTRSPRKPVDVLAIESNYCPQLQLDSNRPEQLKRRIMGGKGHLSNQQAAEAVQAITPVSHVVLLHLSRQCNTPELAAEHHAGADYALTITEQFKPSRWIGIAPSPTPSPTPAAMPKPVISPRIAQTATLWSI